MPTPQDIAGAGPVAQLGYVVDDIPAAMDHWTSQLDVGPFFHLPSPPLNDLRYRGVPVSARIARIMASAICGSIGRASRPR